MAEPVIVLGAGVAGISASLELAPHTSVSVIEARPYIGGRARSFMDRETGEIIDNGQHLLMGCYTDFLSILQRLGTDNLLKRQEFLRVEFTDSNGENDLLDCSLLPGALGVAIGMLKLRKLNYKSKVLALLFAARLKFDMLRADGLTAAQFLEKYHQPKELISRFWEPIILATLNAEPKEAAAIMLVEVLRRAFFGKKGSSQILLASEGLSALFEPFEKYLVQRGSTILTGATVNEIVIEDKKVIAVKLDNGEIVGCRAIISAIPPPALARLLPKEIALNPPFNKLSNFQFSPIISCYLWFDRSVMNSEFTAMLGCVGQWAFNRRALCDAPAEIAAKYPGHITITISAGNELAQQTPEKIALHCAEEIKSAFPPAINAKLLAWKVIKEKSATFLATPSMVEQRPQCITPIKNLFLAGDWTATDLPATLEGAAKSGRVASVAILEYLNKKENSNLEN